MIGSLRGTFIHREASGSVTIDVGGVGYRISVTAATAADLGAIGGQVFLWVHTHVKEDALALYGFSEHQDRDCFEALIAAHGVGPSLAMSIMAVHSARSLARAISERDVESLMLVPGIGKKTAERLLIDLGHRLDAICTESQVEDHGPKGSTSARSELNEALSGLGYSSEEIRKATSLIPQEGDIEDLLKAALRELAGAK